MLVYDITNKSSFDCIEKWRSTIEKFVGILNSKFILVGNKKDLKKSRAVSKEEAEAYANLHKMALFEVLNEKKRAMLHKTALPTI